VGGDIFEWVMRRKGLAFPQALKLVANEIGMSVPEPRVYPPADARASQPPVDFKPFDPDKFVKLDPDSAATKYLVERRLIPMETLALYSVGQTADGEAYAFAYKWHPVGAKSPRFEFCKVVKVDRPGGKKVEWREPKGGRNILFGMLAVPPEATRLVIAEGEIDAMTWARCGVPAVSVPGGAGYLGWIDICWDWLQRFKQIHVSFDEDRAGRLKLVEVVKRLGMARTDMVRLPEKEEVPL
jgi:twinkle protein